MHLSFQCQLLDATNLFPYEGKSVCVTWKKGFARSDKGASEPKTVKKNNAVFKHKFQFSATLKRSGSGFKSKAVSFQLKEVLKGGKLKEFASCTLDLARYAGRRADSKPHEALLALAWSSKPASSFQSLLKSRPAALRVRIDSDSSVVAQEDKQEPVERKASAASESLSSEEDDANPFAKPAPAPAASPRVVLPSASSSSSSNPFASLSRKVGGAEEPAAAPSLAAAASAAAAPAASEKLSADKASASPRRSARRGSASGSGIPGLSALSSRSSFSLSSSSPRDADASSDSRGGRRELKKLKEQLQRSEEKRKEAEKKLQVTQSKVKTLEKYVPKGVLKEFKKDMRRESNPFSSEEGSGFELSSSVMTVDEVLRIVEDAVRRDGSEHTTIYWLSWCCNLHDLMVPQAGVGKLLSETGVTAAMSSPAEGGTPQGRLVSQLARVIHSLYRKLMALVNGELSAFVAKKAANFFDVEVEVSGLGLDLVSILDRYLKVMHGTEIPKTVLNQFFAQTFYYVNVHLFNGFLRKPAMLEPAIAMQLKFYFSEMENWVSERRTVLFQWHDSFRKQLLPIMDLTNVLLLDKSNISTAMLKTAAPYLGLTQVKYLLDTYQGQEAVPRSVLKEISMAAGFDETERVNLKDVLFSEELFLTLKDVSNPTPLTVG